jgi:hypothetical protein
VRQRVTAGGHIEAATPAEVSEIVGASNKGMIAVDRIRAAATVTLGPTGIGQDEIYKVPAGMKFAARRVSIKSSVDGGDPFNVNVLGALAGEYISYLRAGQFISFAMPINVNQKVALPGVETWGDQQGPNLVNGEVFEVYANLSGFGATFQNAVLDVNLEGLLYEVPGVPNRLERYARSSS